MNRDCTSRFLWLATSTIVLMGTVVYGQSSLNFPVDDKPRYFPVGVFSAGNANDDFRDRWYANQLRALKEPSLSTNASAGTETIYRFTWLRTFHHPVAVRITVHANGTGTLTSKMADGAGGYGPGKLITNSTRDVGPNEVQHVLALIDATGFWKMPAENETGGLDGAQWIFEGYRNGSYHVIDGLPKKDLYAISGFIWRSR